MMLANSGNEELRSRLEQFETTVPLGRKFNRVIQDDPRSFKLNLENQGFEFQPTGTIEDRPNRAVLKAFVIDDGPMTGRSAVFFFKRSRVPFSRDRFSYGVVVADRPSEEQIREWLDYAAGGFDPECPPKSLRKAFTFTVPR